MHTSTIKAPVSLLLEPELPVTAKVIWLVGQLHRRPGEIQTATGFSRSTILRAKEQLSSLSLADDPAVPLPVDLLEDPRVGAQAKVLYGTLQITPAFRSPSGYFTYAELSTVAGVCPYTLRRGIHTLVEAGWLRVSQVNRLAPVAFTLISPRAEHEREEVGRARRRIRRAKPVGEAIMREYLSLLVDAQEFEDNAYLSILVNPFTGEMLQLDRYYKAGVAFEFNGPGHYEGTDENELARQRARDHMKLGMCRDAGIILQVVHPEDLSLKAMRKIVGNLLSTRDLKGKEALVRLLESESRRYLATAGDWKGPAR